MSFLKLLNYLNRRDWLYALCALGFIVCGVWLDLSLPDYRGPHRGGQDYHGQSAHAVLWELLAKGGFYAQLYNSQFERVS